MKNFVKPLVEYIPIVVFFIFFIKTGKIEGAIIPLMIATIVAVAISLVFLRKVSPMLLFSSILILVFGALTVYFDDPRFIQFKVTLVNLIFGIVLLIGLYFKKPLLKNLMGSSLKLNDSAWLKLTFRWAIFFLFLAACNEYVYRNYDPATWVKFKLFGIMGLTFIFIFSQVFFIQKNTKE